jgi:hypothetical protein
MFENCCMSDEINHIVASLQQLGWFSTPQLHIFHKITF